jgi:SAM-dependent methyltransferase
VRLFSSDGNSPSSWITDNDRERSATAFAMGDLSRALEEIPPEGVRRVLDIGCGFGGLSKLIGETLGAEEIHGIDIDGDALVEAAKKGVVTTRVEIGREPLPYPDEHFDVVASFGMLDYLPAFDPAVREIYRVLRPDGYALVSLPNLASWNNRLALLIGYQPRDVEISQEALVGVARRYRSHRPTGHIHTPTLRAFTELMDLHGFRKAKILRGSPKTRPTHPLLMLTDRILSRRVSLARRFFFLGQKVPHA